MALPNRLLVADGMIVLLTGAAGLIGGELAARLLAAGHGVIALVRSNLEVRANDGRLLDAAPLSAALPKPGEIVTLTGNVAYEGLGLDSDVRQMLIKGIDLVIHCAAITDFDAAEEVYRTVNVGGTANVLAVAGKARFLHVSTAYVCGLKDGHIAECERDPDFDFANGYERSKADGEALVRALGKRAVIARPSIVVGDHGTGVIRSFDTFYQFFKLVAEGRLTTLPVAQDSTLDFVPIDHVVGGLMDIVAHWDQAAGKAFHLSSGAPITMAVLAEAISGYDHLAEPQLIEPADFAEEALPTGERRLYRRVASYYSSYFQRSPRFATANLAELSGRSCPPVTVAALDRMIDHCLDRGFIRAARQRMSG